jgi:5-methylcytosine-specific restriction endonuclease McrA
MKKALLLSSSYEALSFLSDRRIIKLFFNEKIEVICNWDDDIIWSSGKMKLPSVVRLKESFKRTGKMSNAFNRKALIKRDNSICQYCAKKLSGIQITVDHIIPKSKKGSTSFANCVISCHDCNGKKGDKTLEQSGLKLIKAPESPSFLARKALLEPQEFWHDDWNGFLNINQNQ